MFGRKAKVRKAVARALATVEREGDFAEHAAIDALPLDLRPNA